MLCQPCNGLFDCIRDVCTISSNNGLLAQSVMEIHMLSFRNGVFQVVIVIREAGVRLDLADAKSLQDRRF